MEPKQIITKKPFKRIAPKISYGITTVKDGETTEVSLPENLWI